MSDRTGLIKGFVEGKKDFRVLHNVSIPIVTSETVAKNRKNCETNVCKCYDTSWTCPPHCGSPEFCIKKISSCKDADVYIRRYENIDFKDEKALESMMDGFRQECREIMLKCRGKGYDVFALADGPCRYCERCSVLDDEPCPFPEMQVPSVSGYGIDMTSYIGSIGEKFEFSKDSVTLYGIFLFR